MGLIVQSTGTFTSGFVTMSVLALAGALLMLFGTNEGRVREPETVDAS